MASIEVKNITSTSFQARAYNLMTAGSVGHYVVWYLDGSRWDGEDLADDDTESGWMTFDGLDPDTSYVIEVENITGEGAIMESKTKTVTTESEEDITEWFIEDTDSWGSISSESSGSYYLSEYGVIRIRVGFQESGTATFYSSGASSSRGYLSESTSFDAESGRPSNYLEYDSNTSGDFEFTYEVEAGFYYLFVRHRYEDESGYIDVYITPPGGSSSSGDWVIAYENGYSNVSSTMELEYELLEGEVARIRVRFTESGTAEFYSEGDGDTVGYLSDQDSDYFDTSSGTPNSTLTSNDDGGTGNNFSFTYDVEAGTYYYLYVRHYSLTASGTPTVFIVPPGSSVDMGLADIVAESSASGTEITAYVDDLGTGYDDGVASIRWYIGAVSDSSYFGETLVYDTTSSDSFTFEGLTADTQYTLYAVIVYYVNGTEYNKTISKDVTTNESVTIDGAYVEFGSNTGTTITVSVKGLDTSYGRNDRYIYWSIDGVEKSPVSLSSGVSQSNSYTFTGLSPSTSYSIGARITYTSNGSTLSKELEDISCSTANWASEQQSGLGTVYTTKTASWTLRKATIFYASVKFSQSGNVTISSSGSYDTYGYLTTGTPSFDNSNGVPNNYVAYDDDDGDSSNFSLTYAVEAGVTYYIWVRGYGTSTTVGAITLNVAFSNRPELFTWDDGSTVKTSGKEFDITASEWCALLDNINAVRVYKGYSQIQTGSTAAYFTYPDSGDEFTAIHYNQALNGITGMLGSGYSDNAVSSGDETTAAKINLLVEWLNDIE